MNSSVPLLAFCNCPNETSAKAIAHWLVEEQLAACVNILPAVKSVYRWQGKVETDEEVTLFIKTSQNQLQLIKTELPAKHPYELPELIAVCITDGLPHYLQWVQQNLLERHAGLDPASPNE